MAGGPIFAGLRRAFTEPAGQPAEAVLPEEGTARPRTPDQIARRLGDAGRSIVAAGRAGARWGIRAAAERAIAPDSVTGVSLLLGLCAAAWFSGGTRSDAALGLIATVVWVLSRVGARQLAVASAQLDRVARAGAGKGWPREPDRSDWLILPGFDWAAAGTRPADVETRSASDAQPAAATGRSASDQASDRRFGWLYVVCATAAECAIYGGIAAGAQTAGYTGTWPLALVTVIAGSVAMIARAIARAIDPSPAKRHLLSVPPLGIRALLATLILVGSGPRIALFTVAVIDLAILTGSIARTVRRMSARRRTVASAVLAAYRDDGPLARRAGRLVRGNLIPVPPAVASLIAISLLSVLGLRNLPGIVALTPVVVLLIGAAGSSHPHDGRADWLVPMLLCLSQFAYLVAFGAAKSVPWLVIFSACSMTVIWYTSLVASPTKASPTPGMGWDGRVCLIGLAGIFGIATFGYLGLTVLLGAQICRKAIRDYLRQDHLRQDHLRQDHPRLGEDRGP